MTLPSLNPNQSAEQLFGDIMDYISKASSMVAARDTVNLVGLNDAVDAMCQRIVGLEDSVAKEYAPELAHMMQALTVLQTQMESARNEISVALKSLGQSKKATQTYRNAPEAQG